ncbi:MULTISPECIES: ribosome maturation factor RimM [unclassified Rhizobium]|uniref:ribosome maturation factor RimM n=1 Tax=unclassified Rhizobium TaxID=2613769 RepID=UPI001601A718|nr:MULTISPECIES: ribosome maturation factor RimM [unclassified Rhizobium]MBB1249651.1 ribosome maturation factor RimM [Rhizobium sp. G21]MCV3767432.1 ribosome maturation factor RimM [Rhizobium sp. TRM95796]
MALGNKKLENPVLMGVIGAAQGLRGEVRVKSFTEEPVAISEYGTLYGVDGKPYEILDIRPHKDMVVIRFRGVNDRNQAEELRGTELYVERDALDDEDLDDDEFFYADLEGLEARDADGNAYGVVSGIFDFGAGDILELTQEGKRAQLIPFSEAAVLEIDLEAGVLLIDPIAAGLVNPDGDDEPRGEGRG